MNSTFRKSYITPKIIHLEFETQEELALTFLRFQEFYESPKFVGQIFSHKEFQQWYTSEYGQFSYAADWSGFNIPSYVLQPFFQGKFDPLTEQEQKLLKAIIHEKGNFYIIGTVKGDVECLKHETAHGLFYTSEEYRKEVLTVLTRPNVYLYQICDYLSKNYAAATWMDEVHAYILTERECLTEEALIDFNIYQLAYTDLTKLYDFYLEREKNV